MKKSKLIQLLSKLDGTEMKELGIFLEGMAYKKTGGLFNLYKYLKKQHPEFKEKKVDKNVVHKALYKDSEKFNRRIFDLMSNLSNAVELFLINKKIQEDELKKNFLLLEVYKERQLDKLFFQKINQIEKDWQKKEISGIEHLHNKFKLYQMCFLHPNYSGLAENPIDIGMLIGNLDQYYFTNKIYLSALSHQINKFNKSSDKKVEEKRLLEALISNFKQSPFDNSQTAFLIDLFNILTHKETSNIDNLDEIFYNNIDLFNQYEKQDLFNFMSIIFFEKYQQGDNAFLQKIFELYKFGAVKNLLLEDGYINDSYFMSIVNIACAVKEVDWIQNFIGDYGCFLKEENQEDCINLSKSLVQFEIQEYETVLKNLATLQFQNIIYAFSAKSLQLQCYYELDDYEDLFFNLVKSFKPFIKRSKQISEHFKESISNFVSFTNKLYLNKIKLEKQSIETLKSEIQHSQNLAKRKWLLAKMNDFK